MAAAREFSRSCQGEPTRVGKLRPFTGVISQARALESPMPPARDEAETVSTGRRAGPSRGLAGNFATTPDYEDAVMNRLSSLFAALFLSLLMATSAFASDKVNINTADAATLSAVLTGVGPAKAEAIVAYRTENGPFRSADQLVEVRGIGLATVEKNRDKIIVSAAPAAPAPAR